ncbi:hypothetical protein IL306_012168 [Fusarium sp. DS 682]|nr:hypothetical protein IL306_012168 [Fusarium sp. DS 682]
MTRLAAAGEDVSEKCQQWEEEHRTTKTKHNYRESMRKMQGKRPFLTKMGYLGMGPVEGKPGDVVAIFCGGRIPFVLRPVEQAYEPGEAYCDGVMDGEATVKQKETFWLT